jgi:hypothetical protein
MKHGRTILGLAAPACMLALVLSYTACQNRSNEAAGGASLPPVCLMTAPAPASQPAGPSSVMVYIKMVIEKKYGFLAHVIGTKRDITESYTEYDADNSWWDNPLIVYADAPFAHADVIGRADSEAITGWGNGANVRVRVTLVPHADVAVGTMPRSDGINGTITVSISTFADFYDGDWVEMVRAKDKRLSFSFNTCEPGKCLQETIHETRMVPAFSLERYTRGHEKWEPRSNWPDEPESGDGRTVIYGKDATLDVTGYRYVER